MKENKSNSYCHTFTQHCQFEVVVHMIFEIKLQLATVAAAGTCVDTTHTEWFKVRVVL